MNDKRFGPWTIVQGPFAVSADVQSFIQSAVTELQPPTNLKDRNVQQLTLAERLRSQFDLDRIDALIAVATVYGNHFPH